MSGTNQLMDDPARAVRAFEILFTYVSCKKLDYIQLLWGAIALWIASKTSGSLSLMGSATAILLLLSSTGALLSIRPVFRILSAFSLLAFSVGVIALIFKVGISGAAWIGPLVFSLLLLLFAAIQVWIGVLITKRISQGCSAEDLDSAKSLLDSFTRGEVPANASLIGYAVQAFGKSFPATALLLPGHALVVPTGGKNFALLPRGKFRIESLPDGRHQVVYSKRTLPISISDADAIQYRAWEAMG